MTEALYDAFFAVFSQSTAAWVSAIATIFITALTAVYAWLTKGLLEAQTEPNVVATVVHDKARASVLQIVIKNIGHGLARNIRFETDKVIPASAWGLDIECAEDATPMVSGPIRNGITVLAPGDERRIDWGQYGGLIKNLGDEPLRIVCVFENTRGKTKRVESYLDVKSFEFTAANSESIAQIANYLKNISEELARLSRG